MKNIILFQSIYERLYTNYKWKLFIFHTYFNDFRFKNIFFLLKKKFLMNIYYCFYNSIAGIIYIHMFHLFVSAGSIYIWGLVS